MGDTYERLATQFPASAHKTKSMGGRDLLYVDGEMVVSRLNEVLGFDGWSFEVGQVNVLEDEVWVTGTLTVYSGERTVVREQAGGQIINRTRGIPARPYVPAEGDRPEQLAVPAQKGQIVELSNDIKGAVTDCLKKCATLVGIGLYLYDPAERREVEAEMKAARRAPVPLETKVELAARLKKGIEYARTLGLDPAEQDVAQMNRAEIEEVIEALKGQCRAVLAARKQESAG